MSIPGKWILRQTTVNHSSGGGRGQAELDNIGSPENDNEMDVVKKDFNDVNSSV